jgi:hypothetical protein
VTPAILAALDPLDLGVSEARGVRDLMRAWSETAAKMRSGEPVSSENGSAFVSPEYASPERMSASEYCAVAILYRRHGLEGRTTRRWSLLICFQRDPREQFVPLQRRLGQNDHLTGSIQHTGSAFACPPGARRGGYVGEQLLAKRAVREANRGFRLRASGLMPGPSLRDRVRVMGTRGGHPDVIFAKAQIL